MNRSGVLVVVCLVAALGIIPRRTLANPTCTFIPPVSEEADWNCSLLVAPEDQQTWTLHQAAAHAVDHCPILHMHPAEDYLLTDPRTYYQHAHLYNRFYQKLNRTAVMTAAGMTNKSRCDPTTAARLAYSFLTLLPTDPEAARTHSQQQRVRGSPVDDTGRSTARVFYQLLQHKGAWVYTYNLYYAWNGCGNQAFLTRAGKGRVPHSLEYISCSDSVHESDWERVSVVVCPSKKGGTVVAALLSQHNHHQLINCTDRHRSDCQWHFGDDGRPHLAVYPALHSHANLPAASNATICGQVSNGKEAVFYLDRSADGGPIFVPSAQNVLPVPGAIPGVESDIEDWEWANYPGWWGAAEWRLPGPSITCLSANRLQKVACPDSPAWRLVAGQAGIAPSHRLAPRSESAVLQPYLHLPSDPAAVMPFDYHSKGGAKQGPAYRPWAHHWVGAGNPPLWELPSASYMYRVVLNGGEDRPPLECFPPMTAVDDQDKREYKGAPLRLGTDLWRSVLLVALVPFTMATAHALHRVLGPLSPMPSASNMDATTAHSPLHTLSPRGGDVLTQLLGRFLGLLGLLLPWNWRRRPSSHGGGPATHPILPYAELPVEMELGMTSHSSAGVSHVNGGVTPHSGGSGSGRRPHALLPSPFADGQGLVPASRVGSGTLARDAQQTYRRVLRAVAGLLAGLPMLLHINHPSSVMVVSCGAWVLYFLGLLWTFQLVHETVPAIALVVRLVHGLLQGVAGMLFLRDLIVYGVKTYRLYHATHSTMTLSPTGGTAGARSTVLRSWSDSLGHGLNRHPDSSHGNGDAGSGGWDGYDQGEDDDTAVVSLGSGGRPAGRGAGRLRQGCWLACGRWWYDVLWEAGHGLAITLVVMAVVIVVAQAIGQLACQLLVFRHISLTSTPTASELVGPAKHHRPPAHPASTPTHPALLPFGTAAVLSPRGAINGAEFPGRLYAGSLCVRWRDEFGGGLLIAGALVWAVMHLVIEPGRKRIKRQLT